MSIVKKDNLILGERTMQRLDNNTIAAVAKYSINFTELKNKFCLSQHYNGSNSFFYVNGVKTYQFKAKDSKIKPYSLCLGIISKDFTVDDMKNTGSNGYLYDFFVNYNAIDVSDTVDIHNNLMKKHNIKKMLKFIRKAFIALLSFSRSLTHVVKVSDLAKCKSLKMNHT